MTARRPTRSRPGRRRALAAALGALLVALAGAGAAPAQPAAGAPTPPRVLATEYDDRRAGRAAADEVRAAVGLVEAPEPLELVEALGARLARHAPGRFDYAFRIVDQDAPNAFALPGGYIYVSRGLLALSNSEDELAGVLGHEILHAARRHAAARQSVLRSLGPLQFLAVGGIASYSRDQEREADRLGQGLCGLAGYDPAGMASFLTQLEFSERLRLGASRLPRFFDTHPSTTERAAAAAARARAISWARTPGVTRDRADYLRRLDGIAVGQSAAEGVFRDERFLHPDLDFTLRFPDGWETHNTRRAVGAVSPARDAQVFLELQGEGDDPARAADAFLEEAAAHGLRARERAPAVIGGHPAHRVIASAPPREGGARVVLTFIARGGAIYRLTGVSVRYADRHEALFVSVARSFRALPPDLRDTVRETRLRIVEARAGESFAELSARTGNAWDIERTAVMNGRFSNERLSAGELVKIARSERYAPAAGAAWPRPRSWARARSPRCLASSGCAGRNGRARGALAAPGR